MDFGTLMNPSKLLAIYLAVGRCVSFFWGEGPLLLSFLGGGKGLMKENGVMKAASIRFPFKPELATQRQGVCSLNSIQQSAPSASSPP